MNSKLDKEFENYFYDLLVKTIKSGNMEKRDQLVKDRQKLKTEWLEIRSRITTNKYDNERSDDV